MSYFSYHPVERGPGRPDLPEPRRAEPGEWPRIEAALAIVNRDLAATLPDQRPLILMSCDEEVYVAMPDGSWQGNGIALAESGASHLLGLVADAAQETVMELLWQAWPVCPFHKMGTHSRPEGTTADWEGEARGEGAVWWCRGHHGGDCHDLAPVGELAGALPGKQRRELRRAERRRGGAR
ncbi:hypothetical protein ABZT04_09095 [Streptomyces sp. NPDC005492]|uniref:hypothetical protein n=1 Tax=Streptomyces sp. NPDC005492 TaxID=3156883 RepID=UPI00339F3F24